MTSDELRLASESRPGFRWRDLAVRREVADAINRTVRWFFDWTPFYPARIRDLDGIAGYYSLPRLGVYAYRYADGTVGPADRWRKNPPTRSLRRMLDQDLLQAEVTTGVDWRETALHTPGDTKPKTG